MQTKTPKALFVVNMLYILALLSLPFSDVAGVDALGELRNELSAYMFGLTIAVCYLWMPSLVTQEGMKHAQLPFRMFVMMSFAVLLSFIFNASDIMTAEFRDRSGINKFVTSYMVLAFGCIVSLISSAILSRELSSQSGDMYGTYRKLVIRPIFASACIVIVLSLPYILKSYIPPVAIIDNALGLIIHSGRGIDHLANRFRGVAQEANFFASWAGFAIIWLLAGRRMESSVTKRGWYLIVIAALVSMLILSESRSGYILLLGIGAVDITLSLLLSSGRKPNLAALKLVGNGITLMFVGSVAFVLMNTEQISYAVLQGESLSNLSRFASNSAAFSMLFHNPFLGVGFGQYGHNLTEYMPYWGYASSEVENWMFNPEGTWPPVFSMIARLGAETGVIGILVWYLFWFISLRKVLIAAFQERISTNKSPALGIAMSASIVYVLLVGVSTDSFRWMGIWLTLGVLSIYLERWGKSNSQR